jgi:hypothetical protein
MNNGEKVRPLPSGEAAEKKTETALEKMLGQIEMQLGKEASTDDVFIKSRLTELNEQRTSESQEISHLWNPIHDPTNPSLVVNEERTSIIQMSPFLHRLQERDAESLLQGGQVRVTHINGIKKPEGVEMKESVWIYGGPTVKS